MKISNFILFAAFFIMSCKKSSDNFTSYIKGKLDGVAFECNSDIRTTAGGAGDKTIFFWGDWLSHSIRFYLDGQGSNIITGTHNFQTGTIRNAILYENNDGYSAGYFCGGIGVPCSFSGSGKIVILELSKKYIRGSFEFVTGVSPSTLISKTVSVGEFYIKRD